MEGTGLPFTVYQARGKSKLLLIMLTRSIIPTENIEISLVAWI